MSDQPNASLPAALISRPRQLEPVSASAGFTPCLQKPAQDADYSGLLAGIGLCAGIASIAFATRWIAGLDMLSPMIWSVLIGMTIQNIAGTPAAATPGVKFAMRRVLRAGVILLGFQLTFQQILNIGPSGLGVVVVSVLCCFLFTVWAGRRLGVDQKLAQLIAAGTSICGASAVIAANAVTSASDEDTAYAIVCVTAFGTIAMLVYPTLPVLLQMAPRAYGLWAGTSIHEVAQVVAATYQDGKAAGDYGTITKLTRVIMLAPMMLGLGAVTARTQVRENLTTRAPALPWFVFGFLIAIVVNSVVLIPSIPKSALAGITTFLLSMALAALGLETNFAKIRQKGTRPLLLCAAATLFIASISLILVKITS